MADEDKSVEAESLAAQEAAQAAEVAAAQSAVTGTVAAEETEDKVPWKNRMAEMERRNKALLEEALRAQAAMFQQQLAAVVGQRQAPGQAEQKPYTDEELHALWQQGHSAAGDMLIERKMNQKQAQAVRGNVALAQMQMIYQRYPDLRAPQSPLYQHANAIYQGYLQSGYPPSPDTQVLAMTSAIADRPDLAGRQQQATVQAGETSRQGAVEASQSIGETSYQAGGPRKVEPFTKVTPAERELAKRYQVKDPEGAKKRFLERQAKGLSKVDARISSAIGEF